MFSMGAGSPGTRHAMLAFQHLRANHNMGQRHISFRAASNDLST